MSRTMRHKHLMKEMQDDNYEIPKSNQLIVRVVSSKGNNLHEVEPAADGENYLVSMPNKFRRNVWVKRGDFLVVDPIEEGDKVKAEISRILTAEHVKEFIKQGIWPKKFTKKREIDNDENNDDFPTKNVNRINFDADEKEGQDKDTSDDDEAEDDHERNK